jgi:hypothetical protein
MYWTRAACLRNAHEADTLAEATDRALAMLRSRPHHHSIEIWQGARRLYPVETISRLPGSRQR